MRKSLHCSEVVPGCDFVARGININEVIIRAMRHAWTKHHLRELTPELLRRLLGAIRDDEVAVAEG